jgi:hypothetical protein
MKSEVPPQIEKFARELNLKIHGSPFHGAEGLELWKQGEDTDILVCVGYILGSEETDIYRRVDSKRDVFNRNRLWFFYGWLIKPRPSDNQYRVLQTVRSSELNDELFVAIARDEFERGLTG